MSSNCLEIGLSLLREHQQEVYEECIYKKNGGMSLKMGFGKTLLSIVIGLKFIEGTDKKILVVVSKTLIMSWMNEIKKFFGDKLKYIVFHKDYIKNIDSYIIDDDIKLVLVTTNTTSKYYKLHNIEQQAIDRVIMNAGQFGQHTILNYNIINKPCIQLESDIILGTHLLYAKTWGCLIMDEVQNYNNVLANNARSIMAIHADHKWAISGTIFDEPKPEKIFGYYLLINDQTIPRCITEFKIHIKSNNYTGYNSTCITRDDIITFKEPIINKIIINHKLNKHEADIYMLMKQIIIEINKLVKAYRNMRDTINQRRFGSYLLAMITYLRQSTISPILPIANAILDTSDISNDSKLSKIIVANIKKLNLYDYINDEDSIFSTRIHNIINTVEENTNEKIIIFTCFRTNLDILMNLISNELEREVFTILSSQNIINREKVLNNFRDSNNGILFLTYDIGAEGLNLQFCRKILLTDLYWNGAKTDQAIARILRPGQEADEIFIYYFISNTAMEKTMIKKNKNKTEMINQLKTGKMSTKLAKVKVDDIINILENEDCYNDLNELINI